MYIPIWALLLVWLVLISVGYFFGALMQKTAIRREIIRSMTQAEAIELLATQVTIELKKRLAANAKTEGGDKNGRGIKVDPGAA